MVVFLRAQPGQAGRALKNELMGFADHLFLCLSFAHGTGDDAVTNDAVPLYALSFFPLDGKRSRNKACAECQAAQYYKITTISLHENSPDE
jgi:hypothetical protein